MDPLLTTYTWGYWLSCNISTLIVQGWDTVLSVPESKRVASPSPRHSSHQRGCTQLVQVLPGMLAVSLFY